MKKTRVRTWLRQNLDSSLHSKIGLIVFFLAAVIGLIAGGTAMASAQLGVKNFGNGKAKFVQDEMIVKFKGDTKPFRVIKVAKGRVLDKVKRYAKRADVEYAEPNYIAHALMVPNDPYYSYQWHLDNSEYGGIHTEPAWNIATGTGVTVAIVDTGIAYENYGRKYKQAPDLANTCFVQGYDFVNNDNHPNDDNSHGTHVAGTVAQSTNNGVGVAGVAYGACLMPVKVLDKNGSGTYAEVADGIRYAVDHGAQVINLSLGGSEPSNTLEDAVAYAYHHGVTVVAAAGNDSSSVLSYPAAYDDYVIAVGATHYDETLAYYSNYGPSLDLVAPGGDLNVDQNGDGYADGVLQNTFNPNTKNTSDFGYWFFQGTSMASPHVAGVAALLISNGNAVTPDEVRTALQETAEDLGAPGRDDTYGYGLVDAYAALQWTSTPDTTPPVISGVASTDITSVSATIVWTTDEPSNSTVNYGVATTSLTDTVSDVSMVTSHSIDLTGLAKDTTYYYEVQSTDASGNTAIDNNNGQYYSFTTAPNQAPVADAGPDQSVYVGDTVTFDGSNSYDPDGNIVKYSWDFDSNNGIQEDAVGAVATTSYSATGTYTVTLTVTDDDGLTDTDEMVITVNKAEAMAATITKHDARYRWDRRKNIGKVEVQIDFQVDAGSSNQVVLKEVTDGIGAWRLEKSEVTVKINGVSYVWNLSLDASDDAIIDFEAHGITLNTGDIVQIRKMKLLNTSQGSHTLTAQVFEGSSLLDGDSLLFALKTK